MIFSSGGLGLVLVNTDPWEVTSRRPGRTSLNICVAWSPDGAQLATGGDNSQVTLWDSKANPTGQLTGPGYTLNSQDLILIQYNAE